MSTEDTASKEDNDVSVCANCGKSEEESHKLKNCTACKLVKYCNRECQIAHRPQHKKECKKKAKELYDEKLFKQPPNPYEDCPICFLRMPTLETGRRYQTCCGKKICSGCCYAPVYDNQGNEVDNQKCAFCRTRAPDTIEEMIEWLLKRMEVNDADAINTTGCNYRDGRYGITQDYDKALELFHRAADLGYAEAYLNIGYAYINGDGVEVDEKKAIHYFELGAMGGDATARSNLGYNEHNAGNMEKAIKHYTIAVRSGDADSLERIKELYTDGHASKDDYTKALRSYQAYLGEIKSTQRDEAAAFHEEYRYHGSGL